MSFQIREFEGAGATQWIAEWPFRPRPFFIGSNVYATLRRELQRYVQGEVSGRSFLIAGHRGAGKTALVRQAIEDMNRSIIQAAVEEARSQAPAAARVFTRQRPLAVKLHGPSLLGTVRPDGKGGEASLVALEQIAVALYRALAAEFAQSFANHAREVARVAATSGRLTQADYLESAGQFTLELDNVPRPARLRAYYQRLGRLHPGVLWPYEASTASGVEIIDQGVREIVALATAAQVFEVCAGEITAKETIKDVYARESSAELKIDTGLKEIARAVFALAAGTLAGGGVWMSLDSPGTGTLAGVLTGLASAVTFGWSARHSVKQEHALDYTFIRNRTKQTLERDLPLVIQRVREAGLAPVFVVDELDKLADAETAVGKLIGDLKHLTTDYGCFCFLTDGRYYDHVMHAIEEKAFPVEHSFFSHRFFVQHQPSELLQYLADVAQPSGAPASSGPNRPHPLPIETQAGRLSFSLFVLHRSKLNVIEILRQIASLCDADGNLRPSLDKLRSDWSYLLPAKVQLVIGRLLQGGRLRDRVEADPRFMQLAADALYMFSLAWEQELPTVSLDRKSLVTHLLMRSGRPVPDDSSAAELALLASGVSEVDLNLMEDAVKQLGELLSDQAKFDTFLDGGGPDVESWLRHVLPRETLLKLLPGPPLVYEFRFDIYGQDRALRAAQPAVSPAAAADAAGGSPASGDLPSDVVDQALAAETLLAAFDALLNEAGTDIAELVPLQLLPPTIVAAELAAARARLRVARNRGMQYDLLSKDLPMVLSAVDIVRQNASVLVALLQLAFVIVQRDDPPDPIATRDALAAISRFIDLPPLFASTAGAAAALGPGGIDDLPAMLSPTPVAAPLAVIDAAQLSGWGAHLARVRMSRVVVPSSTSPRPSAWTAWLPRLREYIIAGNPIVKPVFSDLVTAAEGVPPGSLLRGDLRMVTVAEWSQLCARSFPESDSKPPEIPPWVCAVGLQILGLGRDTLLAASRIKGVSGEESEFVEALVARAPSASRSVFVLVMRDDGLSVAQTTEFVVEHLGSGESVLALPEADLFRYESFIEWLSQNAVITRLVYELEEAEFS